MRRRIALLCLLTAALIFPIMGGAARAEEHRLATQGRINGRPARFALDTGVSFPLAMPSRALAKFGLERDETRRLDASPARPVKVVEGFSKPVRIELPPANKAEEAVFAILEDSPEQMEWDLDAVIGWPAMHDSQLHYSRRKGIVMFGQHIRLGLSGWASFPMLDSNVLVFDAGNKERPLPVLIDSGWAGGVQLSRELWKAWRANNGDGPHSFTSFFSPATGFVVLEQVLARRIAIGNAIFSNVLVSEAPSFDAAGSIPPVAVIGLAAFANSELLIDGPARSVHIGPPDTEAIVPNYNRLGATFMPGTMAARVAAGSPAAKADVREGDVLVAIDGLAPPEYASKLRLGPWEQPAGTALTLTLERAGQRISRRVVLQNFLSAIGVN